MVKVTFNISGALGDCSLVQCRGDQQSCGTPGQKCTDGLYCNYGYAMPICESKFPETSVCFSDAQCEDGLVCYSSTGDYTDQIAGEICRKTDDCARGLICSVATGFCELFNTTCTTDLQCQYNQFCDLGICTEKSAKGGNCTSDNGCQPGQVCGDNTCIGMYSVGIGSPCTHPQACKIGDGLGCKGGFCVNYTEPDSDSAVSCNSSSTCFGGDGYVEGCMCESKGDTMGSCQRIAVISDTCQTSTLAYFACMWKNQCPLVDNALNYQSCRSVKCSSQYDDYLSDCNDSSFTCLSWAHILSPSTYISLTISILLIVLFN
ncbi:hypothetical protein DFA_08115 [Cavenderia fasciculata]|uniref:Paramecium surface antigen repeat-containing protein n=1 Tax=Cavenderia fasciculata TaxID=261658 RepID=F4Q574_CACFS|nr:uncharacterized protein DFA_08115 [Cavenderia fasciculata]EGG17133.1 hypothetical protein DFA_08115 [Cavenderia fasciculata]|eukprot:XP_004355617.1 hypothetical protein DFA_08115 [Cavenderia fasciculata]